MAIRRSAFDKTIGFFSPGAELKRLHAKAKRDVLLDQVRKYEGAAKTRRTEGWLAPGSGPNLAVSAASLKILRDRARDLDRNNPWAKRALDIIAAYVVGGGIIPHAKAESDDIAEKVEELWADWGETTRLDATGRNNFYGLQWSVMRNTALSGECLIRKIIRRDPRDVASGKNEHVPVKIQLLEADFIDSDKTGAVAGGGKIINGVEVDGDGLAVAYWLFEEHPGDNPSSKSVRVPASDIKHVFREDRIGQRRGVTFLAPIIIKLKDLDEYEDAKLVQEKVAACFAVVLHDMPNSEHDDDDSPVPEKLAPGLVMRAPPGTDAKFGSPPQTQGFSEFVKAVLRAVAMALGVTYESLTGDLSNVNFSSGRMGRLDFKAIIKHLQENLLTPQFCQPVWDWFIEGCALLGVKTDGVSVEWTLPRWEYLDPVKEATGNAIQVRNGEKTLAQVIKETGRDPSDHLDEIAEMNADLDSRGIKLDSDPRQTSPLFLAAASAADSNQNGGSNP